MAQERLFAIAPDALSVSATFDWRQGWSVTIWSHARGIEVPESQSTRYDSLTALELLQVIESELARRLVVV